MSNILLIGKDLPDCVDFAEALSSTGQNSVFTVAKSEADTNKFEAEYIFGTTWNKSSAVSAHSLLIKAENKLEKIDHIIFYFDTPYYCSKFELDKTEEVSSGTDTMISSYLFSINEILKRIDQRKDNICVTFLVKEYPSKAEITLNSKIQATVPASSIVSASQAFFENLAENFAINVADRNYLSVILAKCSVNNELYKNERAIAKWCLESHSLLNAQKNHQNVKNAANWNKVGTKIQTGFAIFR